MHSNENQTKNEEHKNNSGMKWLGRIRSILISPWAPG